MLEAETDDDVTIVKTLIKRETASSYIVSGARPTVARTYMQPVRKEDRSTGYVRRSKVEFPQLRLPKSKVLVLKRDGDVAEIGMPTWLARQRCII